VQLPLAGIVPLTRPTVGPPAPAVTVPPQVVAAFGTAALTTFAG
jgi:hypothetical protein